MIKIKRIGLYVIVITLLIQFVSLPILAASTINQKDIELYKEEIKEIIPFKELSIINKEDIYYLSYNNTLEVLPYNVIKAIEFNDYIYILASSQSSTKEYYIIKLSKETKKQNKKIVPLEEVNDLIVFNNNIVVGGMKTYNLALYIYDTKLEPINEVYLDGDKMQKCTKLFVNNNLLYVVGLKSAHTNNKHFANVGNRGDIKSFIFSFDDEYQIINKCYINELYPNEVIDDIGLFNNNICINLKSDKNYLIELDESLNIKSKTSIGYNNYKVIYTSKNNAKEYILIVDYDEYFNVITYNKDKYKVIGSYDGRYRTHQIINGELIVYYALEGYTYKKIINEYHVDYVNELKCDYFANDETQTDHFKVDSFFEDLKFTIDSITPQYERNTPGNYIINYLCHRSNGQELLLQTPLKVMNYVNIYQNGVYPKGKRLYFFGKGYLNDQLIPNGTMLQTLGLNTLKIVDANQNETIYNFIVVDEYYKDETIINVDADFVAKPNEKLLIRIDDCIKNIYSNENIIGNIQIVNDYKYLEYTTPNSCGTIYIPITSIELTDGTYRNYNNGLIIKVVKPSPAYEIYEFAEKEYINLSIDVCDDFASIDDIYLECYQDGKIIYQSNSYLKNTLGTIDKLEINKEFEVLLKVRNESGEIDTLFSYQGKMRKSTSINYDLQFEINNKTVNRIKFKMNLRNKNLNHTQILLGKNTTNDLCNKYTVKNNYILLYISIGISIVIISLIVFFILKRKSKFFKNKKKSQKLN